MCHLRYSDSFCSENEDASKGLLFVSSRSAARHASLSARYAYSFFVINTSNLQKTVFFSLGHKVDSNINSD